MRTSGFPPIAALLSASAALGGAISGQVVEAGSGRPIPGAVVIASGEALQGERIAQADDAGVFAFEQLPPGAVSLDVQARGYQSATRENVPVHLDETLRLRLELLSQDAPGAAIGRSAQMPAIFPPLVTREQAELIPYGRERLGFIEATDAIPGVLVEPGGLRVPGALPEENRYLIDGVDTTDPVRSRPGTRLSQRFVDEVTVLRDFYPAEFGRATGAVVHAETRSGGNDFHGSLFGFALPFEASRRQPGDALNFAGQSGVELGGPLQRDRLWFHAGLAPETVSLGSHSAETDLQYAGKLSWRPSDDHALSLSAFGDPGSGAGSNDLSMRYAGNAAGVAIDGGGFWHHARDGADRVEATLSGGSLLQLAGHHRVKAGADIADESAGSAQQTLLAAFAQDSWAVLDAFWIDAGVRAEEQRGPTDASAVLPRLAASWDFTGRGLSRIYAAWGRFFRPASLGGLDAANEAAFSSGAQLQLYRDFVASFDYTHKRAYDAATFSIGKQFSENYLLQASFALAPSPGDVLKLEAAYVYEWSPKTSFSLGTAVHAVDGPAWEFGVDARAAVRHALSSTYQLAVNLDVLNATNHQSSPAEAPVAVRAGATLSF